MPTYFPENNEALPTDSVERSMAKVVSQLPAALDKLSLDPHVAVYVERSGATDVANLDAFVKGVKELGLWDSMVCWPLRSSQNSGTNTAYSLGGLGTFDGTLVNSPTWGADGLVTDATNESVQLPDAAALYNARSGMVAFKTTDTGANRQLIEFQSGTSTAHWYCLFRFAGTASVGSAGIRIVMTRDGTASSNDNQSRTIDLVNFQTGAFTMDDSTDNVFRNGSVEVGAARTGLPAINPTGARSIRLIFGNSTAMTGAFAMTGTVKWTDSQVTALHNLYKATLGAGLSLP